jgi:transketolase
MDTPTQEREARALADDQLDQLAINTIRALSIDAVQQADSGNPGTPMALAPLVYTGPQCSRSRDSVLPPQVSRRIAVEQGSMLGWDRYVGPTGKVVGMKTFGASAPLKELQRKFGFEPERVIDLAREMLQ